MFGYGREFGGAIGVAFCGALFHIKVPVLVGEGSAEGLSQFDPIALGQGFTMTYGGLVIVALVSLIVTVVCLKAQPLSTDVAKPKRSYKQESLD